MEFVRADQRWKDLSTCCPTSLRPLVAIAIFSLVLSPAVDPSTVHHSSCQPETAGPPLVLVPTCKVPSDGTESRGIGIVMITIQYPAGAPGYYRDSTVLPRRKSKLCCPLEFSLEFGGDPKAVCSCFYRRLCNAASPGAFLFCAVRFAERSTLVGERQTPDELRSMTPTHTQRQRLSPSPSVVGFVFRSLLLRYYKHTSIQPSIRNNE